MRPAVAVLALSLAALAAITVSYYRRDIQTRRQRLTLDRMEMIASAVERFRLKNGRYPEAADAGALLKQVELPDFSRPPKDDGRPSAQTLDPRDGWGRAMRAESRADGYLLVSNGRDGVPDAGAGSLLEAARAGFAAVRPPPRELTTCYEDDLVFTMGLPLRSPDPDRRQHFCR